MYIMSKYLIIARLQVQNAIEYLKIIGALDESENLTVLGMLIFVYFIMFNWWGALFGNFILYLSP